MENKRVMLGMSGGVDSSVAALLLKNAGYDVIGATLELFAGSSCCNIDTYIDAKNVCNQLGIPHFTFNYKDEFRKIDIFSTLAHNKLWIAVYRSNNTNILTTTLVYLQYNRRL